MLAHKEQDEQKKERSYRKAHVMRADDGTLLIENQHFTIRDVTTEQALDLSALAERYMPLFDIYDYVVGDWSYGQLRLKGFYADDTPNVPLDKTVTHLPDYLLEFCSFGCEYFVLEHQRTPAERQEQLTAIKDKSQQNFQERKQHKKQTKKSNNRQRNNKRKSHTGRKKRAKAPRSFAIQDNQPATTTHSNRKSHPGKKSPKKAFEIH